MIRSIPLFFAIACLASPALAFPVDAVPIAPIKVETLEVKLTKSNACKPKYRHRKSAQEMREKAHCK